MGKRFDKRDGPSPWELKQVELRDKYETALEMELDGLEMMKREDAYLIREFFMNLNECMTITAACARTGISTGRLKRWRLDIGTEFETLIMDFENVRRIERLEETLYERAKDPDNMSGGSAAMFLLKGRKREVYGDKLEVDSRITVQHDLSAVRDIRAESQARIQQIRSKNRELAQGAPGVVVDVIEAQVVEENA